MSPDPVAHSAAPPNDLQPEALHLSAGIAADSPRRVSVDPSTAHWRYLSFRLEEVGADDRLAFGSVDQEAAIVVIAGGGLRVRFGRETFDLEGRATPFDALPTALYLPHGRAGDQPSTVEGLPYAPGGLVAVAIAEAPRSGREAVAAAPMLIARDHVRIEVRGAGNATRQINHLITPDFPADRLEVVEVLTPSGNWSSWPPHKHDVDDMPTEAVLEEVYAYWFRRPEAWAIQRLYRADRSRNASFEVREADVVLVTDGYHPFVATHGDDAYYLNALAGDRRTMACSFDPDLDWVRAAWADLEPDPRVPLVGPR